MIAVVALSRDFGGVKALDSVTFETQPGEIVAVAGPSGAGKTTLVDVISGALTPSSGTISAGGVTLNGVPAYRRVAHGIARTHQRPRIFADLTVMDNVMAGLYRRPGRRAVRAQAAQELLETFGLFDARQRLSGALDHEGRRMVEIARAFATAPRCLLLDEPFEGTSAPARAAVVAALRRLAAQTRATVVIATRDLTDCMDVCTRAIVLDAGKSIAQGAPADVAREPDVRDAYLGVEWRQ